jgi:hypothetical protein
MAFSFDCPHCEMGFEAEFELCGSTCTCPGCGGLFLVPEVDPALLRTEADGVEGNTLQQPSAGGGGEWLAQLEQLKSELVAGKQRQQELEKQLAVEKQRAARESALLAELTEIRSGKKDAEAKARELIAQNDDLQKQLREAGEKVQQREDDAFAQRRESEGAVENLRKRLSDSEKDLETSVAGTAKLRGELEEARAQGRRWAEELENERRKFVEQAASGREALEKALADLRNTSELGSAREGELKRAQEELAAERGISASNRKRLEESERSRDASQQALEREMERSRSALEDAARAHAVELAQLRAASAAIEKELRENKVDLERSAASAGEAVRELERLKKELAGVKAEKWSAERGFAEEHTRLLDSLRSLECERDSLREEARLNARAAEETDGEPEKLRRELSEALATHADLKRSLEAERSRSEGRLVSLERAKVEAESRVQSLLGETVALRSELEQARKVQGVEVTPAQGLDPEAEAELRRVLARRDLEIQRLTDELRDAARNTAGELLEVPSLNRLRGGMALALAVVALSVGLLVGTFIPRAEPEASPLGKTEAAATDANRNNSRLVAMDAKGGASLKAAPNPAGTPTPPVTSAPPSPSENAVQGGSSQTTPQQSGAVAAQPPNALTGTIAASRAGMPSNLPDQFLGIRFGTDLAQVSGIAQWKETAGKRHRKAELLGSEVEAVLTADTQNRLIMGSYVRVAPRQPEALSPFLEWAVNVQDAVSALYGEPVRVHSVDGATDAVEVVRKISAGEDYYQASWERDAEDGVIDLSIRVFNERSVVFRMEYRARQLYTGFMEAQAAAKEASKDSAKEPSKEDPKGAGAVAAPANKEQ